MKKTFSSGFTLVELAIVLIIVGLLVGGILGGQELVEQARIRNVISQIRQYDTAINTFRAKYNNQIPGDFSMASVFGLNLDSAGSPNVATALGDGDYNGDGDGVLENDMGEDIYNFYFCGEMLNFWVHLSNAELIKESLSQPADCSCLGDPCDTDVGTGVPSAEIGVGIVALTDTANRNKLTYVSGTGLNVNSINGSEDPDSLGGDTLTPQQAYGIDSKLDDGKPDAGGVRVIKRYLDGTFEDDDSLAADDCYSAVGGDYNYSVTEKVCTIRIVASN